METQACSEVPIITRIHNLARQLVTGSSFLPDRLSWSKSSIVFNKKAATFLLCLSLALASCGGQNAMNKESRYKEVATRTISLHDNFCDGHVTWLDKKGHGYKFGVSKDDSVVIKDVEHGDNSGKSKVIEWEVGNGPEYTVCRFSFKPGRAYTTNRKGERDYSGRQEPVLNIIELENLR